MTITDIDSELAHWRDRQALIEQNLDSFSQLPVFQRACALVGGQSAAFEGRTQSQLAAALEVFRGLGEQQAILAGTLQRAAELRASLSRLMPARHTMEEIEQLLTGPSIQIESSPRPAARRELLRDVAHAVRVSPGRFLEIMLDSFRFVRDTVIEFETAERSNFEILTAQRGELDRLRSVANSNGKQLLQELDDATHSISELTALAERDPLAAADRLATLVAHVRDLTEALDAASKARLEIETQLRESAGLIEKIREFHQRARQALVERQMKCPISSAAAENITYGDAERGPIRDMMNGMSAYDDAVARAVALHDLHDAAYLGHIRDAESLAHNIIIPASEALDKANQAGMDQGYTQQQSNAGWSTVWLIATCSILLVALATVQILLRRRTHRRISPPLLAAALSTLLWTCWIVIAVGAESHELKVAKQDAFDSLGVLWRARADAYSAQSNLSLSLLDPASAQAAQQAFVEETSRLATLGEGINFDQVQLAVSNGGLPPEGFKGYIADELRNITFDGEQSAANEMLARFSHYMNITNQACNSRAENPRPEAIALCIGDSSDDARGALKAFDDALDRALQINQHAFDEAVNRGFQYVAGFSFWNIGSALAIAITAHLGLSQRLTEYSM